MELAAALLPSAFMTWPHQIIEDAFFYFSDLAVGVVFTEMGMVWQERGHGQTHFCKPPSNSWICPLIIIYYHIPASPTYIAVRYNSDCSDPPNTFTG